MQQAARASDYTVFMNTDESRTAIWQIRIDNEHIRKPKTKKPKIILAAGLDDIIRLMEQ